MAIHPGQQAFEEMLESLHLVDANTWHLTHLRDDPSISGIVTDQNVVAGSIPLLENARHFLRCHPDRIRAMHEWIETLRRENLHLTDEVYEAQNAPWPQWADSIFATLSRFGAVEESPGEELDLGEAFEIFLDEFDKADKEDRQNFAVLEGKVAALRTAAKPFVGILEKLKDKKTPRRQAL